MAPFVAKLALILSVVFFAAGENGEPDYPDVVSIFGTNSSENYTVSVAAWFGQYSKMQGVSSNGRPVWKHNSRDDKHLFYHEEGWWLVGDDYESKQGLIYSKYSGEEIPRKGWRRSTGGNGFVDDSTLTVEGLKLLLLFMHDLFTGSAFVAAQRKTATVEEKDRSMLTCRTTKPIAICTFIAPNGAIYSLESTTGNNVSKTQNDLFI